MPTEIVDSAIVVPVGPCIDDSDFKTLETALTYDQAGMSIYLFKKTSASLTATELTLTTGGANDWTHKALGVYEVEITAAQNDTEGELWVAGVCTGVLVFESPHYSIVVANVYNSLIAGSDNLQVDTIQLAGVAPGTIEDLGSGASLAKNLRDLAGATFVTGTDSQEAIANAVGGTPPTVEQIRAEMDSNSTQLAAIVLDTGTTLPAQITTAQNDLDLLTGADGATLATAQGNYAPLTVAELRTTIGASADDTIAELAAIPAAAAKLGQLLQLPAMMIRNGGTVTASARRINKDDGTALGTGTVSDDGTTTTIGELS